MKVKFIEAVQGKDTLANWGKFMIGRFDTEWQYRSALPAAEGSRLLSGRGWSPQHILFVDLQTGEGTMLMPGGYVKSDLEKHAIWICPLAEPFLVWLYQQDLTDLDALPALVELPDAEFAMAGYRRPGQRSKDKRARAAQDARLNEAFTNLVTRRTSGNT